MSKGRTAVIGFKGVASSPNGSDATEAELYQILLENTVDLIARWGPNRRRSYISPSSREVLGYTPLELLSQRRYATVHPEDRPEVERAFAALGVDNDRCDCTFRVQRKDGRYIWIEGRYRFLVSDGSILAVLRDVSRRKEAEEQATLVTARLESVNATFARTLDHMVQGVCLFDGEQKLQLSNRRYAELYGLDPAILRPGMTLEEVVSLRYAANTGLQTSSTDYLAWREEVSKVVQPDESEIVLCSGRVIRICHYPMDGGGWVATHEDLTEQRRTQQMLNEAKRLEAVGRLTGGVAHEFNNALQIIGVALEEALEAAKAAKHEGNSFLSELLAHAGAAVAHGGQLTQRLLTFSRRQLLRPAMVDLVQAITSIKGLLCEAGGVGTRVDLETKGGPFRCMVDPAQFESAILNLVLNAGAAMPGGGTLTIALTHAVADDTEEDPRQTSAFVRIVVRDEGQGIPSEALAHVFEPFFTTKQEQSGLGLAQVYGFALQSGGSVSIASKVGVGTTVSLLLPASELGRE